MSQPHSLSSPLEVLSLSLLSMTSTAAAASAIVARSSLPRKPSLPPLYNGDQTITTHKPAPPSFHDVKSIDVADALEEHQGLVWKKSLCSTLGVSVDSFYTTPVPRSRPLIVGHRGCLYDELENTRASFSKTFAMGADAVELDVFLLKCGTLVVFHGSGTDETPGLLKDYTVNMTKSVLEYTNAELQEVVFNKDFAEFGCDATKISNGVIPTLEQVLLDAKQTKRLVKIELKGPGTAEPTLRLVEEHDMQEQCHFSSFDLRQIAIIRALRPQVNENGNHVYKTGALFNNVGNDYLQRAMEVGASEVHLRYDECTKRRVDDIHKAGMDSMAWFRGPIGMRSDVSDRFWDVGNEDASMYHAVMKTGVRQMCVNRPDVLVDMFR